MWRSRSKSGSSSQCGVRSGTCDSTIRWRKRSYRPTRRSRTTAVSAARSIGSSNHMTEVITIRLVGRSMCSHAASALDICSRVIIVS